MTLRYPRTEKTSYTVHDDWFVFAAAVWTIVELTVPRPTQDASDITNAVAMKPEETEAPRATSAVKYLGLEEAKRQTEGISTEKSKENCQANSIEVNPGCE